MNPPDPDWLVPDWPAPANVRALVTTRAGGTSRGPYASLNLGERVGDDPFAVERNRGILRACLPGDPVWLHQVHGTEVADAAAAGAMTTADGAVARIRHAICAVLVADCMPVLLTDRAGTVVAIAHAGWRGLAAGVIEHALASMRVAPREVIAWLGPAIGQGTFEVGAEVYEAFTAHAARAQEAFMPGAPGKWHADLALLARQRLDAAGVTRVSGGGRCTFTDAARFFSYRRDGATGRMAALVWLD